MLKSLSLRCHDTIFYQGNRNVEKSTQILQSKNYNQALDLYEQLVDEGNVDVAS
jgi:hypothetical protein